MRTLEEARIDAGFAQIRWERFLRTHLDEVRNADYWRALNPQLTISDAPFAAPHVRHAVDPAVAARCREQLLTEGYLQAPPLVRTEEAVRLKAGILRVVEAGFPSPMACVYDEFYRVFLGLEDLFEPVLGPDYRMILLGLWTFHVAPGNPARSAWTALSPHRDGLGPDPRVLARELPSNITLWLPLTDVTTEHSCMYVVPAPCDPDFYTADRQVHRDRIRLQDIRALPAPAGSILGWSSHLVHWGSRSSRFVETPRIAVSVYLQRGDIPPRHPFTVGLRDPVPFGSRLLWIEESLGRAGLFTRREP